MAAAVAACGDDGAPRHGGASLCPTVQAWSDAVVQEVKDFRLASRGLDPAARRARYLETFAGLERLGGRLAAALDELDLADAVARRLDAALEDVAATVTAGAAEAAALPDDAYELVAVGDGSLVTGVEKAKAVVFAALGELAEDESTGVPRGCGRRAALDSSPPATLPG
jgi:hypothetical protein